MRPVNLLPAERVETREDVVQRGARTSKAIAVAAGLAVLAVALGCAVAYTQARGDVHDRQATLGRVEAKVTQAQAAAALSATAAAAMQAHLAAVTSAASGRTAWDGLLDQLSRVLPRGAWLESMQTTPAVAAVPTSTTPETDSTVVTSNALSASTSSSSPTAATVTVSGYARTQDIVAQVLDRLALMPSLSDVSLQSTQRASDTKTTQFTITANVHGAGGNG